MASSAGFDRGRGDGLAVWHTAQTSRCQNGGAVPQAVKNAAIQARRGPRERGRERAAGGQHDQQAGRGQGRTGYAQRAQLTRVHEQGAGQRAALRHGRII